MKTGRRLIRYTYAYKKIILAALFMLTIAAATDLAGPFIAKNIIDNHILGIESEWHETKSERNTVEFQGKHYKKAQNFTNN